jgi:hypothetical protein
MSNGVIVKDVLQQSTAEIVQRIGLRGRAAWISSMVGDALAVARITA